MVYAPLVTATTQHHVQTHQYLRSLPRKDISASGQGKCSTDLRWNLLEEAQGRHSSHGSDDGGGGRACYPSVGVGIYRAYSI